MSGITRRLSLPAVILVAALAAACGGGDDKQDTSAATPQAATQAAAASPAATQAAAATATPAQQSRTFTDDNGKTLTIATPPKRVVAVSPSMVELLYAVDAPPIARVSSANYPDAARSLPAVGSAYQVSLEQVAAQQPDFILADQQIQGAQVIADLQKIAPVFAIRVLSVDDVPRSLRLVGQITGKMEQGEKAAKEIEDKLKAVQAKLPQQRPSVFIMIGDANAFFAAKPNAFVGDVAAKLGAKNVVPAGPDTSPFPGFTSYSLEQLAQLNPDVILVLTAGPPNVPRLSQVLKSNPAWNGLRAVKENQVHEIDPVTLVQSAGPRVSKDIDELAAYLYPGVFPAKN
jgi:iron complex transport system substrate-binding protein